MDPELIYVPEEFESERLLIRSPRPGDGAVVNAAIRESIESLRPWLPWAEVTPEVAQTEEFVRESYEQYRAKTRLPMLLFRKDTDEFVGGSGLHDIAWNVPRFEIGYWVRSSCEGKGYITEAVMAISEMAFRRLGACRVCIRADTENTRSRRVAERAGFELEGTMRCYSRRSDGSVRDTLVFSKVRRP